MGKEVKKPITVGFTDSLLQKVDNECLELGMSRSAFLAMCINTYFRNQEAMSLLSHANDLMYKAQSMQESMQTNLWNQEVSMSKG